MSSEKNYLNDSYKSFFEDSLSVKDPELYKAIKDELIRQQQHIELIASENIVSQAVLEAQGSVLTNKYAEGYPGKRYYNGCEHAHNHCNIFYRDTLLHTYWLILNLVLLILLEKLYFRKRLVLYAAVV